MSEVKNILFHLQDSQDCDCEYLHLSLVSLDLDNGPQEHIELHRVLIEVPILDYGLDLLEHHSDDDELGLPALID